MGNIWTTKDVIQTIAAVFQGLGSFSIVVAIFLYYLQRKATLKSEMQTNRSRVTEAYLRLHETILGNDKNAVLSGKMLRRGHVLVRDEFEELSEERSREVHLLAFLLNVLFLEWHFRNTYLKPPFKELEATIDNVLYGVVVNANPHYANIIDNIDELFPDFAPEFIALIIKRISIIREHDRQIKRYDHSRTAKRRNGNGSRKQ